MLGQLLFIAVITGAPPEGTGPRLDKGLELRWSGTFSEVGLRPGARSVRTFDVETRFLVLDTGDFGADGAICTRISLRADRKLTEPVPPVVRLDLIRVDPKGKVQLLPSPADADNPSPKVSAYPSVALQGLPIHETGMFVEGPEKGIRAGQFWMRTEGTRPIINWKVPDSVSFRGQLGHQVVGEQYTPGYYADRVYKPEWRRVDTLTVMPGNGFASRFERVIERREPEAPDLAFRSTLKMELQGRLSYSGRLLDERREEAYHAAAFAASFDRLLADGGRAGPGPFVALASRVEKFMREAGASDSIPFREASLAVRRRAIAASKGDLPPVPPPEESTTSSQTITLTAGKPMPDATLSAIVGTGNVQLSKLKGKAQLIIYFQPSGTSAAPVMKLAEELAASKAWQVVPLSIGDASEAKKLHTGLSLTVPIYDGMAAYRDHGVDATPVFVVVDAAGTIQFVARGWTPQSAGMITKELQKVR